MSSKLIRQELQLAYDHYRVANPSKETMVKYISMVTGIDYTSVSNYVNNQKLAERRCKSINYKNY